MSYPIPIRNGDSVVIYASQKTITVLLISTLKYLKTPHALLWLLLLSLQICCSEQITQGPETDV